MSLLYSIVSSLLFLPLPFPDVTGGAAWPRLSVRQARPAAAVETYRDSAPLIPRNEMIYRSQLTRETQKVAPDTGLERPACLW